MEKKQEPKSLRVRTINLQDKWLNSDQAGGLNGRMLIETGMTEMFPVDVTEI